MTGKIISNRQQKNHSFRSFISGRNAETIQLPAVKKHGLDYPLLIAVILICAFGIVMLFSASYYYAELTQGDGLHYVRTQSIFLFFGLIGMLLLSHVPYTFYSNKWVALSLYAALIVSLLAVKLVGVELQGSKRWLSLGFTTVQPSEFSKIILTICMGGYAAKHVKDIHSFSRGLLPMLLMVAVPVVFIYMQPNLSMLLILMINFLIFAFVCGCDWRWLLGMCIVGTGAVAIYLLLKGNYQSQRFFLATMSWEELQELSGNESFQIVQSLYAFANGGLFGQGFDASRQKLLFLPYRESDYILPIIAEELGFVAVLLLLASYFFIIYRGLRIASNCKERFGSLLAVGISTAIGVQVFINAAVVSNLLPATGQTLPFISSGGTSLFAYLVSVGILLNVSRYTERNKAN